MSDDPSQPQGSVDPANRPKSALRRLLDRVEEIQERALPQDADSARLRTWATMDLNGLKKIQADQQAARDKARGTPADYVQVVNRQIGEAASEHGRNWMAVARNGKIARGLVMREAARELVGAIDPNGQMSRGKRRALGVALSPAAWVASAPQRRQMKQAKQVAKQARGATRQMLLHHAKGTLGPSIRPYGEALGDQARAWLRSHGRQIRRAAAGVAGVGALAGGGVVAAKTGLLSAAGHALASGGPGAGGAAAGALGAAALPLGIGAGIAVAGAAGWRYRREIASGAGDIAARVDALVGSTKRLFGAAKRGLAQSEVGQAYVRGRVARAQQIEEKARQKGRGTSQPQAPAVQVVPDAPDAASRPFFKQVASQQQQQGLLPERAASLHQARATPEVPDNEQSHGM